jgi:hypothetical protein
MKIRLFLITVLLTFQASIFSDDPYVTYTGEVLQCNLKDGKDVDDVLKMVKNDWYDLEYPAPYEGWVLTPTLYSSSDGGYDLAWAGFTFNNTDMGNTLDWFFKNGTKVFSKWRNLVDCASWSHWDIFQARQPSAELDEGDTNYWAFSSCSFREGKSASDLRENDKVWNKYLDSIGHTGGVWRWWPGGGSDSTATNDFYINVGFSSMAEYGAARDARLQNLIAGTYPEGVADCDQPRVYSANNIKVISE